MPDAIRYGSSLKQWECFVVIAYWWHLLLYVYKYAELFIFSPLSQINDISNISYTVVGNNLFSVVFSAKPMQHQILRIFSDCNWVMKLCIMIQITYIEYSVIEWNLMDFNGTEIGDFAEFCIPCMVSRAWSCYACLNMPLSAPLYWLFLALHALPAILTQHYSTCLAWKYLLCHTTLNQQAHASLPIRYLLGLRIPISTC